MESEQHLKRPLVGRRAVVIAAMTGILAFWALRPQPERSHLGLVEIAVPAGWKTLPITARAGLEVVEARKDEIIHRRPLGRFIVRWNQVYYHDGFHLIDSGQSAVRDPDLAGELERDSPCGTFRPDELREDATSELWVLSSQSKGEACVAFRRGKVVDKPAIDIDLGSRLGWSALAAALVLAGALALGAMRRAEEE